MIFDANRRFRRSGIVSVLEEFREDVPRALHLFEQLMPGTGEFQVLFQLNPPLRCPISNALEICWLAIHLGSPARSSNSAKS